MKLSILYEKTFLILDKCSSLTEGACTNPDILKVIMFIQELLKIVFFIVPIGLMLMIAIDLIKNVMASKDDEQKKNISLAIKRAVFCVAIFFVPTIVNVVNSLLIEVGVGENFTCCLENANSEYIEKRIEHIASELNGKARGKVDLVDPESTEEEYNQAIKEANAAILELDSYLYKIEDEEMRKTYENYLKQHKENLETKKSLRNKK